MKYFKYSTLALGIVLIGCSKKTEPQVASNVPSPALKTNIPSGQFSPNAIAELEKIIAKSTNAKEKAVANLIILAHYASPGSNISPVELRSKFQTLAEEHAGTWIAVQCKIGIVETYDPSEHYQKRIETLNSILNDRGLKELANPTDPYLQSYLQEGDGIEVAKAPSDFILSILTYNYVAGFDISSAIKTAEKIQSPHWKAQSEKHIKQLATTSPDVLTKRREHFIRNQKP